MPGRSAGSAESNVEATLARVLASMPRRAKRVAAGRAIRLDGLELDLDMQLLVRLSRLRPRPPLSDAGPDAARQSLRRSAAAVSLGAPVERVEVRALTVAGAAGPLPARLYVPEEAGTGLLVYFHGGGWVAGDLDTHDEPCRVLALSAGIRVVSVDYRLSPEHPFPAPVQDALASFRDCAARAEQLGADPARIGVAGDSAGGHLAAVTALQCALDGGPAPAFQLLIYPATDLLETHRSERTFASGFILTKENMDWYEAQFAGADVDRGDPRVSPLQAPALAGVAPAMVVTAGFDPLRDEGEAYARRLHEAGVRTVLRRHAGAIHGFIHALAVGPLAWRALGEMGGVLRSALEEPAQSRIG
jgi:acetyl esterase